MKLLPFVQYVLEDKSKYVTATEAGYYDPDNDFLIGESGAFLPNINFKFVNTHLLRKAGRHFEKFGYYTDAKVDSPPHRRYRIQEENRRRIGFTAKCKLLHKDIALYEQLLSIGKVKEAEALLKPLRIAGEHYNFINYGAMRKLDEGSVKISKTGKVTGEKKEGIPDFFGAQYWWYKVKEFARNNGYHVIGGKSRRGGFSYMEGVGSANTTNNNRGATVIHAASDFAYLKDGRSISRMALMQIEFYETHTPFKRGIISQDLRDIFLGYKRRDNKNGGYQSHILSLSTGDNNADIAIGKDAVEIKCEEMSAFDTFNEFMDVTEPTTRTGAITTGLITAWGTGGSKTGNWEIFEENFYNPKGYNFMPFENIWDWDSRDKICGYFKPYIDSLQGFTPDGRSSMDKDGNTNYDIAYEISMLERAIAKKESKTLHDYIIYCGQYANMPSESFSSTTDNMFTSEALTARLNKIRNNPDYQFYTDGMPEKIGEVVKFKSNVKLHDEGKEVHHYIEDIKPKAGTDRHGCVRVWHPPYVNPLTKEIPDIYSITYDTVGKDKKNPNSKTSNNSISVWMNPNPYFPNVTQLRVAHFFGRPELLEQADMIALKLCLMYGGHKRMMLHENNRGETKSNFKKWGYLKLLDFSPVEVWDTKIKGEIPNEYGIDLTNDIRKIQGLELLKEMLYERIGSNDDDTDKLFLDAIPDPIALLEISKWNNDGNFDRVSDFIVRAFQWKKLKLKAKKKLDDTVKASKIVTHIMEREWA